MKFLLKNIPYMLLLLIAGRCGCALGSFQAKPTEISFLSVGQGDCTFIGSKGYTILVDDGPATPNSNAANTIIIPWLEAHGYHHLDAIFLSHPDQDHVGGTPALLYKYPGAKIVVSDQFQDDPEMKKRMDAWNMKASSIEWLPKFSEFDLGDLHVAIECPDRPAGQDANSGSMFVRVSEGEGSVVFSGDAPKATERSVEKDENWNAEILHVGHHGSRTASDESWLNAVNPRFAVISVGRNNRYGHPNPQTLEKLSEHHIPVLRTDTDGTIVFRFNGSTFVRDGS